MQDAINESTLRKRAKESASYLLQESTDFDKAKVQNTYDSWQEYLDSLDQLELYHLADEDAESWDWIIYNGKALELCANVYGSTLDYAEELYSESGAEAKGFYEMVTCLAYFIVQTAILDELDSQLEGLRELATACQESTTK